MLPKILGISGQPVVLCIARLVPEIGREILNAALSLVAAATLKPRSGSWAMGRSTGRPAVWQIPSFLPGGCAFSLDDWTSPPYYAKILFGVESHPGAAPQGDFGGQGADVPVAAVNGGDRSEVAEHGETGWLVPTQNRRPWRIP